MWYLTIFRKSAEEVQTWLKYDKNKGTLHENVCAPMLIYSWILLQMRSISEKICRKIKTYHVQYFIVWKSCRLWDNMEKRGRTRQTTDGSTKWLICFVFPTTKARIHTHTQTHTHTIFNTYCFSKVSIIRRMRINVTFTYVVCLVSLML